MGASHNQAARSGQGRLGYRLVIEFQIVSLMIGDKVTEACPEKGLTDHFAMNRKVWGLGDLLTGITEVEVLP